MEPSAVPFSTADVPRFTIDLDVAPEKRWAPVCQRFKKVWPRLLGILARQFHDSCEGDPEEKAEFVKSLHEAVADRLAEFGCEYMIGELSSIAEEAALSVEDLMLLQLSYEATCGCLSLVATLPDGSPILARTMDWDMPSLRELTIEVDFVKSGKLLYSATTWAGYIGVLTATKPNAYSVSVNFRGPASEDDCPQSSKPDWPVALLLRHVLAAQNTYEGCIEQLASAPLMAPTYIAVVGTKPGQGTVITRSCHTELLRRTLFAVYDHKHDVLPKPKPTKLSRVSGKRAKPRVDTPAAPSHVRPEVLHYLVQTNMDYWDRRPSHDLMESLQRERVLSAFFESRRKQQQTEGNGEEEEEEESENEQEMKCDGEHCSLGGEEMVSESQCEAKSKSSSCCSNSRSSSDRDNGDESSGSCAAPAFARLDVEDAWKALSIFPIWDDMTIYGTVMIPSTGLHCSRLGKDTHSDRRRQGHRNRHKKRGGKSDGATKKKRK